MKAILVFIDGTICDTRHRHELWGRPEFYSDKEALMDTPVPGSVKCLRELADRYIIVYIGARPETQLTVTKTWLEVCGFPVGEVALKLGQQERLELAGTLKRRYDFAAGIGDRWDDNELHLEIGCKSIILQEFEGNWDTVRKHLGGIDDDEGL